MPVSLRIVLFACIMVVLSFLIMSCTIVMDVPQEPIVFSAEDKISMRVALRLDDTLCAATWNEPYGFHVLPIGVPLCMNAESLARALFTEVEVLKDNIIPPLDNIDAVLIPNLLSIERDFPITIYSTQTTSMLFTWTLNDKAGDPIWVTTIVGEGKAPRVKSLEQIDKVLDDVFQQSLHEMSSSPLIREFAANLDYSSEKPQAMTGLEKQKLESLGQNDSINLTTTPKGNHIDKHDKYKIAFLPWDIGSETQAKNLINKIADYIKKSDDLEIIASCYDLSRNYSSDVEKIRSIEKNKIWKKYSIFEVKKPDTEQVCKIGEELDADAIMVVAFSKESNSYNLFKYLRIYLIDVTSGKQCVFNNREKLNDFNFNQRIFEILDNVFNDYRDLRRDVA